MKLRSLQAITLLSDSMVNINPLSGKSRTYHNRSDRQLQALYQKVYRDVEAKRCMLYPESGNYRNWMAIYFRRE